MKHIMLDLETMGTKNNSAIVSIAAVVFDMTTGTTGDTFYKNVTLRSCVTAGLTVEKRTKLWWKQQDKEVQQAFTKNAVPLYKALKAFSKWMITHKDCYVWGNSARFDLGILENAYTTLHLNIPWNFQKEADVRTLIMLVPEVKEDLAFVGMKHNSLDDCFHQIKYCVKAWNKIYPGSKQDTAIKGLDDNVYKNYWNIPKYFGKVKSYFTTSLLLNKSKIYETIKKFRS